MQCYTPHIRYYQKVDRTTKEKIDQEGYQLEQVFIPREQVFQRLKKNENYLTAIKRWNDENKAKNNPWRYQALPCRHCYACSLNYAAQWATRMACECLGKDQCYFITLTYNERCLPIPERIYYGEDETAFFENDGTWTGTLVKKEIQDFVKRLRRYLEYHSKLGEFKFFLAGEYGEGLRPHYHAILMDCKLDESQFYECHKDPNKTYETWKSHELDQLWSIKIPDDFNIRELDPNEIVYDKYGKPRLLKGFVQVAKATWQDMAYVARYTAKKAFKTSDNWEYYTRGMIPEFITMSKGIGDKYFLANLDKIFEADEMIAKTIKNQTSRVKPPKRAEILLERINPEKFDEVKAMREQITEMLDSMVRKNDDYSDLKKLQMLEDKITTKAKMLKREM